jgi:hypothetical protein
MIGFGIQVRESGRKSFTLDYTFECRRRRLFIGDFPDWSTVAAREQAKRIKREVDQGIDPLAVRDERRTAPTLKDLIERYLNEHVSRLAPDSASDQRSMMMTYVMPVFQHMAGNRSQCLRSVWMGAGTHATHCALAAGD